MVFSGTLLSIRSPSRLTPRLVFQVDLESNIDAPVTVHAITGEMSLLRENRYEGLASLNTLLTQNPIKPRSRSRFELELDLSFRQIEIIEERRNGQDVEFRLILKVLFSIMRGKPNQVSLSLERDSITLSSPLLGDRLMIPQSEWLKMLQTMRYTRLRVIELPIPRPPKGTLIDSSVGYVEEALRSFNEGNYDDVLTNCRKAFEELDRAKINLETILESESKTEKVEEMKKKVKDFLNLGPHAGVALDRKDAELALYSTVTMIRYLAKQLAQKA